MPRRYPVLRINRLKYKRIIKLSRKMSVVVPREMKISICRVTTMDRLLFKQIWCSLVGRAWMLENSNLIRRLDTIDCCNWNSLDIRRRFRLIKIESLLQTNQRVLHLKMCLFFLLRQSRIPVRQDPKKQWLNLINNLVNSGNLPLWI